MPIEGAFDVYNSREAELERKNNELQAKVEADRFDRMTGLSGGDHLVPKLEDLVKKLNSTENKNMKDVPEKVMVIALDMNGLKFFNDTYGHAGGNKALTAFANRLRMVIKDVDFIFRHNKGGDEFVILLQIFKKEVDPEKIFKRIKESVNNNLTIKLNEKEFAITAAMGYTMIEKGTPSAVEEILNHTDLEMYKDKERMKQKEISYPKSGLEDYSI
ncbi:MAG: GGDEF domain-containing protein [Minisyncoccia bacterium]